eukprot:Lithocolla_globosa_v1_NODE_743_length_3354_cov_15.787814.p3 type:complete len:190 gc:universal NODE_743_length_3354_cov_15.787814:1197-628(-)
MAFLPSSIESFRSLVLSLSWFWRSSVSFSCASLAKNGGSRSSLSAASARCLASSSAAFLLASSSAARRLASSSAATRRASSSARLRASSSALSRAASSSALSLSSSSCLRRRASSSAARLLAASSSALIADALSSRAALRREMYSCMDFSSGDPITSEASNKRGTPSSRSAISKAWLRLNSAFSGEREL